MPDATVIIDWAWVVLGIIWLGASFTAKRNIRKQPLTARVLHVCVLFVAFALIFSRWLAIGLLAWRPLPPSAVTGYAGLVVAFAGMLFALWARFLLGRNWSGVVTVKRDHELVRNGPYALVRHPIYSGLLFALLGTVIARGFELRAVIGFVILLIAWRRKSLAEESFMVDQFGAQYIEYRRRVRALVPYVW